MDLLESQTPKTVNNFIFLAEEGFYDDLLFFKVVTTGLNIIQGGDSNNNGTS